jgi:hypothetical protein
MVRRNRHYMRRGLYVTCAIVLCVVLILLVRIGLAYDGICTSAIPEVAAPTPCSFWQYLSRNTILVGLILAAAYWPLLITIVLLPPLIGYLFDRRIGHSS